jgi:hypothetical protein
VIFFHPYFCFLLLLFIMLKKFLHALTIGFMAKRRRRPQPSTLNLQPSDTELEQVVDEARRDTGRGPAPRSPQQGILDMQARIAYHTVLAGKLQLQLENAAPARLLEIRSLIRSCERQLTEARHRLAEYQLQVKSQN